jgi:hypothetical protein
MVEESVEHFYTPINQNWDMPPFSGVPDASEAELGGSTKYLQHTYLSNQHLGSGETAGLEASVGSTGFSLNGHHSQQLSQNQDEQAPFSRNLLPF